MKNDNRVLCNGKLLRNLFLFLCLTTFLGLPLKNALADIVQIDGTFPINYVITGQGAISHDPQNNPYDFGTVELKDNDVDGRFIDIIVTLDEESPWVDENTHIKVLSLNYIPNYIPNHGYDGYEFFFSLSDQIPGESVLNDEDSIKMGGFKDIYYDLRIPGKGNLKKSKPLSLEYIFTLGAKDPDTDDWVDLDYADFHDTAIPIALHIGGLEMDIFGQDSAWVGDPPASTNPVPEPVTILLVGSGVIGLTGFRRKFTKK